jgi:hypothetical protein
MKIFLSFLVSFLFIYAVGYFFCDTPLYYVYNEHLGQFIHSPGVVHKQRSEGFGETHKGLYGVNAIHDISNDKRYKIAIWGDSYVEAHQVDDALKMPQIVTAALSQNGFADKVMSFGIGMSGDSVADYYFEIPKYEDIAKKIIMHFILITSIDDILPDQPSDDTRGLFRSNPLNFYLEPWEPRHQDIKKFLYDYKIYFLWDPVRTTFMSKKQLRFMPGKINSRNIFPETDNPGFSDASMSNAWIFLCSKLREQTQSDIVFLYCPVVPRIEKNKIRFDDQDLPYILRFSAIAKNYNIRVIDTSNEFITFFKETGHFPRGFGNSRPSIGHFNKYGHEIVSRVIISYLLKKFKNDGSF